MVLDVFPDIADGTHINLTSLDNKVDESHYYYGAELAISAFFLQGQAEQTYYNNIPVEGLRTEIISRNREEIHDERTWNNN